MIDSPLEKLPDLCPVKPSKPVRIQFEPSEVMHLHALVSEMVRMLEASPPGHFTANALAALESIQDKIDAKLDFKPV